MISSILSNLLSADWVKVLYPVLIDSCDAVNAFKDWDTIDIASNWESIEDDNNTISIPFTLPVKDALILLAYTVLHFAPDVPKSRVPFPPGTKLVVNTPGTLILSPVLFPKNKLPDIATSPLKYAFDAVIFPVNITSPFTGAFKVNTL